MGRGLSELQKEILIMAYRNHKKQGNRTQNLIRDDLDLFFSEFMDYYYPERTNSQKAAVSRAFKRLEARNLIKRYWAAYSKWMGIELTDKGIAKSIKLLTNQKNI